MLTRRGRTYSVELMEAVSILREAAPAASPVMAQYFAAKASCPDALLFFRMGDFYELFFDDAAKASAAIGIALTQRGAHAGSPIPMAGVPVHAAEAYLAKLIRAGFKVAVCDQVESPEAARKRGAKAIVRRELVRVVTPGTLTEDGLLEARGANRLAAVAVRAGEGAVASVELSTGEVECAAVEIEEIGAALAALRPAEVLVSERLFAQPTAAEALKALTCPVEPMAGALAEPSGAEARVKRIYGVATLDGFGSFSGAEIAALGLIAAHLETTQAGRPLVLRPPRRSHSGEYMSIDPATRASLELDRALSGRREGALLAAIDRTATAAGARLLAARLARPLVSPAAIEERLDAVGWMREHPEVRHALRACLRHGGDMARALTRLSLARGGPRDLACVRDTLTAGAQAVECVRGHADPITGPPTEITRALGELDLEAAPALNDLRRVLIESLTDQLPAQARDGGFVAPGVAADLDEARGLRDDSRKVVAALEGRLGLETGIALRIRHNAVLGYFVEASAKAAEPLLKPPLSASFIHRQTLANQVRFTTLELADLDSRIARAGDLALSLELALFETWRTMAQAAAAEILAAAEALAVLDVAAGLAEWAEESRAVRPRVDNSFVFEAVEARHPAVEPAVTRAGSAFTANDCRLDGDGAEGPRLAIVTGPNMAGKSTFLRQNALLAVLAQAGSFVPARALRLGVVDRLFSRVGAGDDLAQGRSTFLTEMVETAAILTQAGPRAFVILDEIGRGTATFDGLAIAWACAEALHDANRCRALFATHYHELAALEDRLPHVANLSLQVREWNGELVFLHEAAPGCADRSYGVQVARLAGVPAGVVARAREVLTRLERDATHSPALTELPLFAVAEPVSTPPSPGPVETALAALDLDGMSPREAMEALYRLKGMI